MSVCVSLLHSAFHSKVSFTEQTDVVHHHKYHHRTIFEKVIDIESENFGSIVFKFRPLQSLNIVNKLN